MFRKVFGFSEPVARKHMLEVHEQGRSIVWSGRELLKSYGFALQTHLPAVSAAAAPETRRPALTDTRHVVT